MAGQASMATASLSLQVEPGRSRQEAPQTPTPRQTALDVGHPSARASEFSRNREVRFQTVRLPDLAGCPRLCTVSCRESTQDIADLAIWLEESGEMGAQIGDVFPALQ